MEICVRNNDNSMCSVFGMLKSEHFYYYLLLKEMFAVKNNRFSFLLRFSSNHLIFIRCERKSYKLKCIFILCRLQSSSASSNMCWNCMKTKSSKGYANCKYSEDCVMERVLVEGRRAYRRICCRVSGVWKAKCE